MACNSPGLCGAARADEPIRIGGSSSGITVMRALAELTRDSGSRLEVRAVPNMSTGGAIRAVGAGALEVAISTRDLTPEESALGLMAEIYGRVPLALVVRPENPVDGLSTSQLADLWSGRRETWPDGQRVRVVLPPSDDADDGLLRAIGPEVGAALDLARGRKGTGIEITDVEMAQTVSTVPGAIGSAMLSLVLVKPIGLKPLALNGVVPSAASVRDGGYPMFKTYRVIVHRDPGASVRKLLDVLHSDEGRALLTRTGHG